MKNSIYIVLIKSLTGLGKFSRTFSNYEYTHISICLDDELNDFLSFSRRRLNSLFDAGFTHEYRDYYAFSDNSKFKVKVFKLDVDDDALMDIKEFIDKCNSNKYIFNIYSMLTMPLFHGFRIYKAYNCMSFVGMIIKKSKAIDMKKPYYKYDIKEMDELLKGYEFYEGYLNKYNNYHKEYMVKDSFYKKIHDFFKINYLLIKRIIKYRDRIDEGE